MGTAALGGASLTPDLSRLASRLLRVVEVVVVVYARFMCETKAFYPSLCRAFSVAENLESLWAIAGHGLIPLLVQELIDCAPAVSGCDGGLSNDGFAV